MTIETQNFRTTKSSHNSSEFILFTGTDIVKYKNVMCQEKLFYPKLAMALLHNHCCSVIAVCTKPYECMSVFWHYLSCMHSACAISYFNLWPVWLYHIFPHYPINGTIFDEEIIKKFILISSVTFLIIRRNRSDILVNILYRSLWKLLLMY